MIIDASVAFKLMVEEPGSEEAIRWVERAEMIGPSLIHAEVANALWKRVRNGELADDGEAQAHLADLSRYVRTIDHTPFMPRALALAGELANPVYDCVYLALAEGMEDELLTADLRFVRAVASTAHAARVRELGT
ncbi:MAG TPA: type II toxin-antitoxin system VapC family toxin [Allosphingosinicella sp.]